MTSGSPSPHFACGFGGEATAGSVWSIAAVRSVFDAAATLIRDLGLDRSADYFQDDAYC